VLRIGNEADVELKNLLIGTLSYGYVFLSNSINIKMIFDILGDKYQIKISTSIEIKTIALKQNLLEQIYVKDGYFKTVPNDYPA